MALLSLTSSWIPNLPVIFKYIHINKQILHFTADRFNREARVAAEQRCLIKMIFIKSLYQR